MSTFEQVLEGLQVIHRYEPASEIAVGHDCLYAGGILTKGVAAQDMEKLGWWWDAEFECFGIWV